MIALLGLDHQRANADVRGRLSFTDERLRHALATLKAAGEIDEVVILSTCNRTEAYVATSDWASAEARLRSFFADAAFAHEAALATQAASRAAGAQNLVYTAEVSSTPGLASDGNLPQEIATALYACEGQVAVNHLFLVAAGLQSMVVGEAQILGQV
ncbi:MAG TPA: hypothetical protein VKQ36_02715, partial [Ktedonobacterales bacterium]|nr:hypothetical protein [Ktedonobacterales bacterium]